MDDELDIPEDIGDIGPSVSGEEGYFVPPTKGTPPSQVLYIYNIVTCTYIYIYQMYITCINNSIYIHVHVSV